jgi:hypothetical protein
VTADAVRRSIPPAIAGAAVGYRQGAQVFPPLLAGRVDDMTRRLEEIEQRLRAGGL